MPLFSATTGWRYGNDATSQPIFVLSNRADSRVNVYVRRLALQLDAVATLTSVLPIVKTSRCTSVSGGAKLPKAKFDNSASESSSSVEVCGGFMENAPIDCTPGDTVWQQFAARMHSAAEQQLGNDSNMLPIMVDSTADFILRPGEAIACTVVGPTGASNAALTNNWLVTAVWEETLINTFAISGQVTLSAVGVSGALVTVMEADDESMTNARLVEVVTTDGSGNWASTIRTGCVGAAFVQYKSGATYYTAPGSPYLD